MGKIITEETKDNVVKLYTKTDAGKSVIMALIGVGRNTFYNILKERGIPTGKSFNASDIETAVVMYRSGDTVKEILEKTGISNKRLYSEIEKERFQGEKKEVAQGTAISMRKQRIIRIT